MMYTGMLSSSSSSSLDDGAVVVVSIQVSDATTAIMGMTVAATCYLFVGRYVISEVSSR